MHRGRGRGLDIQALCGLGALVWFFVCLTVDGLTFNSMATLRKLWRMEYMWEAICLRSTGYMLTGPVSQIYTEKNNVFHYSLERL